MKRIVTFLFLCASLAALVSCSKSRQEQMLLSDKVKVSCEPQVLEVLGDEVNAQLTITYSDGYFLPEATMVVTPVLVYPGGECTCSPFVYQGAGVKDNNKVILASGSTVSEKVSFKFVDGMQNSHLELRSVVFFGSKKLEIPAIKVAEGIITTSRMAVKSGAYKYKEDGYQHVVHKTAEGQIHYNVNSANVKSSELRNNSIKELKAALKEIADDERYKVTGTRIEAYASPEGGQEYNAKLSDKRASSAQKAWGKVSGGKKAEDMEIKSLGQDWEGFKEAVTNSKIEDKDLILRVLSMYSDPAVREREIRNMSEVYTEINKKVFPELRRACFITEVDYQNFTDEELEELSRKAIGVLDEAGLLRVAAISEDVERKSMLYQQAVAKFDSQKAAYNLVALALDENKPGVAEIYLDKLGQKDADSENLRGVVALQRGDFEKAEASFKKSNTAEAVQNLGTIAILKGDYKTAAANLTGSGNANEGLALILAGRPGEAEGAIKGDDARSDYLRAIAAARKGEVTAAQTWLSSAKAKSPELSERAATDVEFLKLK